MTLWSITMVSATLHIITSIQHVGERDKTEQGSLPLATCWQETVQRKYQYLVENEDMEIFK